MKDIQIHGSHSAKKPRLAGLVLACITTALLSGCSVWSKKTAIDNVEAFDSATFSRNYDMPPIVTCPAAQRALLSQGYNISSASNISVVGRKHFLQTKGDQYEIEFTITCLPDQANHSSIYVNAVQHLYTVKQANTSATLGVSMLGSVSMPIGSTDDSLVKIGSVTIASPLLYQQFFLQLEANLPEALADAKTTTAAPPSLAPLPLPLPIPVPDTTEDSE